MSVFRTGISFHEDIAIIIAKRRADATQRGYSFNLSHFISELIREHDRTKKNQVAQQDSGVDQDASVIGEVTIDVSKDGGQPWHEC